MQKRMRRAFPVRRMYLRVSEAASSTGITRHAPSGSTLLFYLWSAVPGLPHFARGQRIRGHIFLWSYLVTLLLGLALMGSMWGSIFIGLAFSIHSSAIADLINQDAGEAGVGGRMMRGLAVSAALFAAVYWPTGMLIGWVAAPYQLQVPLRPFETGDVVFASTIRGPRAGDVVLYELPHARVQLMWREGMRERVFEGRNIDRILAGPGATVEFRDNSLFVNGSKSASHPLNPLSYPDKWKETVPQDCYFLVPSDEPDVLTTPGNWQTLGFVPQSSIVGKIYLRTQPWRRFSIIR